MNNNNESRIYIACLASYNNGILHGQWIDANQEASDLESEIQTILAKSPIANAEEWAIHDYDNFGSIRISEYETMETISNIAEQISEHGTLFAEVYSYTNNLDDAQQMLQDRYIGTYDSILEYVEETTDLSEVPEHLQYYIDLDSLARDIELSGEITTFEVDAQLAIFS